MKKLIIVLLLFTSVLLVSVTVNAADLFVFDNAEVLSDSFESDINEAIIDFKQNHNADLVILTTDTLDGRSPSYYADDFYDYNGFDQNGILLLISFEDNDVYISTSGNGINAFTDYGIDKALRAGYNELYSTAQDIVDKKMAALDKKIEQDAVNLAIRKIDEVKSEKAKRLEKKEKNFEELVTEMAKKMITENQVILGQNVAKEAINKIDETKEEGGNKNEEKTAKRTRKSTK